MTSFDFPSGEGSVEEAFRRNWAISKLKVSNSVEHYKIYNACTCIYII